MRFPSAIHWSLERKLAAGFAAVALIVGLALSIASRNSQQLRETRARVAHSYEVKNELEGALRLVADAESGVRGFVLTGQEPFLEQERDAEKRIWDQLRRINGLTGDDPNQQHHLAELKRWVVAKLEFQTQVLRIAHEQGLEAGRQLVATGRGLKAMQDLRGVVAKMMAEEDRLLRLRQARSEVDNRAALWTSGALAALILAVLAGAYLVIRFHLAERRRAEEAVQRGEENLAVTLQSIGDAVLATDPEGKITRMNRVAERLTGWNSGEAQGRPIREVYCIINEHTRAPAVVPVDEILATGKFQGLADHTVLIARDGTERSIADSAAPIRDGKGRVLGVVHVFRDVTETHAAEKALRASEEYNRSIVESSEDCLKVLSLDGHLLEMAAPGRRIMEVTDFEQIRNADWLSFWKGEDAEAAGRALQTACAGGTGRLQGFCPTMAGTPRWWEVTLTPILGATGKVERLLCISRDITKRRQAEEELHESQRRLAAANRANELIMQHSLDVICTVDAHGRFVTMSAACEKLWGYRPEELLGRRYMDFVHPENHAATNAIAARIMAGEPVNDFENWYVHKNGSLIPVTWSSFWSDAEKRMFAVAHDSTERKRIEAALESARDLADRANHGKSEFLSRMSHELRTPMNAILGFAQVMEMDNPPEPLRVPIGHIIKAGHHLLELINEVLDISRVEAGRMTISVEPVHLGAVVEECVALIRPLADQRSIRIVDSIGHNADGHVSADRQRLKQALLNLLSNAVKFNREGGCVTISCEQYATGTTDSESPKKHVRLSIADTGYGMAAAELPRLFEPFERLNADRAGVEGTGLGLALTKRLVELMGGTIHVTSNENCGSVFSIELKVAPSPVPSGPVVVATAPSLAVVPIGAVTVLYIEDNLSNLQLIEHLMTHRPGVKLLAAMQGSLGLELAHEHRPKLILLDLNLPDMPGREVLRRLRGQDSTREIPVVVISADATPREIQRMLAAGALDYFTKPLDLPKFLAVIDRELKRCAFAPVA